ncbi:MAG: hypothetical protein ACREU7_00335, partial [Burkholderiales bacterium]
ALTAGASLVQAGMGAVQASFTSAPRSRLTRLKLRALTAFLHTLQPLARWRGRRQHDPAAERRRGALDISFPRPRTFATWSEHWQASDTRLQAIEAALQADGVTVLKGGVYDRWDLETHAGMLGAVRILLAIEEYGAGRQLVRFRTWPRCSTGGVVLALLCAILAIGAALHQAWAASALLGLVAVVLALCALLECAAATAATLRTLQRSATAN